MWLIAAELVALLSSSDAEVVVELSWLFAFLTAKEDMSVQEFLQHGLAAVLVRLLSSADPLSTSTVPLVRCLGNLTSGTNQCHSCSIQYVSLLCC